MIEQGGHLINIYELLAASGVTFAAIIGGYVRIVGQISNLQKDTEYLKKELDEEKRNSANTDREITRKMDILLTTVTDIKVAIAEYKTKN